MTRLDIMGTIDRVLRRTHFVALGLVLFNLAQLIGLVMLSANWLAGVNLAGGLSIAVATAGHQITIRAQNARALHPSSAR